MTSEESLRESKSQLARLMAMENIVVEHQAKFHTAMFSPERRILYLPIWKNITEQIYLLFVAHEISHALHTPRNPLDYWLSQIEPKKPIAARRFLNVVEDARVEKLIKRMYPGVRRSFVEGYKDLIEIRDFFGSKNKSYNSYGLVDRINIHFKLGVYAGVIFGKEERVFVDAIKNVETFQEVMVITKELYQYCKEHREESPETTPEFYEEGDEDSEMAEIQESFPEDDEKNNGEISNKEESDGDENESGSEDEESKGEEYPGDDKEGEGNKTDKSGKSESDSDKDSETGTCNNTEESPKSEGSKTEETGKPSKEKPGESDSILSKKSDSEHSSENIKPVSKSKKYEDKPRKVTDDPVPCETQENFDQNAGTLNDPDAKDIEYVNIPNVILNRIIVSYKEVHENIRNFYSEHDSKINFIHEGEIEFSAFRKKNDKVVSLFHKEFELRKAANISKRIQISHTGLLNTNKIHSYQYSDDIFLSKITIQEGKNHGLIIFIDFSGSMINNLRGTIEQLLTLILFCRKSQIPFEVYGFGNVYNGPEQIKCRYESKDLFIPENFKLRQYFHYKMTTREYNEACINMMIISKYCGNSMLLPPNEHLGGTPLNEALVCAFEIIKQFKDVTGTQIVHTVVMSDGDANGGLQIYVPSTPHSPRCVSWCNNIVIFRDPLTRHEYKLPINGNPVPITKTLLTMLKDRLKINAIGFYLMNYSGFKTLNLLIQKYCHEEIKDVSEVIDKHKELRDTGVIITKFGGYTTYYLLEGGKKLETSEVTMNKVGRGASVSVLSKSLSEMGQTLRKTRILACSFIKLIVK